MHLRCVVPISTTHASLADFSAPFPLLQALPWQGTMGWLSHTTVSLSLVFHGKPNPTNSFSGQRHRVLLIHVGSLLSARS